MTVSLLGGCGSGPTEPAANPSGSPMPSVPGAVPRADHVLLVVFENKAYQQVIGSAAAPYLTSLAHAGVNSPMPTASAIPANRTTSPAVWLDPRRHPRRLPPATGQPPTWHVSYSQRPGFRRLLRRPRRAASPAVRQAVATPANTTRGSTSPTSPLARTCRWPPCPPTPPRCPPSLECSHLIDTDLGCQVG